VNQQPHRSSSRIPKGWKPNVESESADWVPIRIQKNNDAAATVGNISASEREEKRQNQPPAGWARIWIFSRPAINETHAQGTIFRKKEGKC